MTPSPTPTEQARRKRAPAAGGPTSANRLLPLTACALLLGLASPLLSLGCKPRERAYEAVKGVQDFGSSMADAAGDLGKKTGTALGLVKPLPADYVRLAYGPGEQPATLRASYTLAQEREAGLGLAAHLLARYGHYQHDGVDRYLARVAGVVAAFSDRPALPPCVAVLRSEAILSFGLPGGYVLLSLGALRTCESESELAGVLAQALAHTHLRHGLRRLETIQARLESTKPGQPFTLASAQDLAIILETEAQQQVQGGFSAEEVWAADQTATDWLVRAGYEPGGLKSFLARAQLRLKEETGALVLPNYSAFHKREEAIAARLAERQAPGLGQGLQDRYRRECLARLPVPLRG